MPRATATTSTRRATAKAAEPASPRRPLWALWALRSRWRRSLQLRVVATTFAVSAIVVALVGFVVMDQVRAGVLKTKEKAAVAQAAVGIAGMQTSLDQLTNVTDPDAVDAELIDVLGKLSTQSSKAGEYDVLLLATGTGPRNSFGLASLAAAITPDLRHAVSASDSAVWRYVSVPSSNGHGSPALAVGGRITAGDYGYQLYYVFPLHPESVTLALVQRTLFFAGASLVLLLVAVAWLVTSQVVRPVQHAARSAELLAAGRLQERMSVRGEDELATLAESFNHMAASLQRQIRELEALSRLQRRFVSDVSHELRTPLTTVRMAADVLHAGRADYPPAVARSAELLQHELDRFESLLVDLLEISRYDAGAAVLDAEPVDLRDLVRGVVDIAAGHAAHTGCELVLLLPPGPVVAEVDGRRVQRILRNLVSNALDHGERRPVTVELAGDGEAASVVVRDQGIGLKPGESTLVFNRFWRADPARARTSGGTGLGLSIALEDARLHHGWLQAWGEPGAGATFRLTLPCRLGGELHSSPLPLRPHDQARPASSLVAPRALPPATPADADADADAAQETVHG